MDTERERDVTGFRPKVCYVACLTVSSFRLETLPLFLNVRASPYVGHMNALEA